MIFVVALVAVAPVGALAAGDGYGTPSATPGTAVATPDSPTATEAPTTPPTAPPASEPTPAPQATQQPTPFSGATATATTAPEPSDTPATSEPTPADSPWSSSSTGFNQPTPPATPDATAAPVATASPTPADTASGTPPAVPSPTPEPTPTGSPSPIAAPTPEPTPTASPTAQAEPTPAPTDTPTPSPTVAAPDPGTPSITPGGASGRVGTPAPTAQATPSDPATTPNSSTGSGGPAPSADDVTGAIVTSPAQAFQSSPRATVAFPAILQPSVSPAPNLPPAGSVVPAAFGQNMTWSKETGWHWATETYDGSGRYTSAEYDVSFGRVQAVPFYVATQVRALEASDPCDDCVMLANFQQGPPKILGGPDNPALKDAYAHILDGPRQMILDGTPRWTKGSWYLNYDPGTGKFFSWTWIPEDWTQAAQASGKVPAAPAFNTVTVGSSVAGGATRLFPLAGSYEITQPYGCVAANPGYPTLGSCPPNSPSFHDGVDFGAPAGTPIFAVAGGTVIFVGIDNTSQGNSKIVIQHDGANADFQTIYLHWSKAEVTVGQHVSAGQVIGEVGSVGFSTGPHLHFSVVQVSTGNTVDPLSWLRASVPSTASVTINTADAAGIAGWAALITQAAAAHHIPAALVAAIMTVESDGNPNAVSPQGAQGLMQIMPSEFQRYGIPVDKWLDPATNVDTGARLLAEALSGGGTLQLAVQHYFGIGCDALGTCTDTYLARVEQWLAFYQQAFPDDGGTATFASYKASAQASFIWPTSGTVTQPFGPTTLTLEPAYDGYAHFHQGIDIANNAGTPIVAAGAGTVIFAGMSSDGYGNCVEIDHGNGLVTLYGHMLQTPMVSVGQHVEQGQQLGLMGSTGNSTGNHLHFAVTQNGVWVDPRLFVR